MTLPAKSIPETVAHLDMEVIEAALVRNDASVRNAARDLNVPSADLRKLVLLDQRLKDVSTEAVELQLDECEANLRQAVRGDDLRLRVDVSKFLLRNTQRAAARGYAVAASAASLEMTVNANAQPVHYVVRWQGDDDNDNDKTETIERDGRTFEVPKYGKRDDVIEGELSKPRELIEHDEPHDRRDEPQTVQVAEPEPVAPRLVGTVNGLIKRYKL